MKSKSHWINRAAILAATSSLAVLYVVGIIGRRTEAGLSVPSFDTYAQFNPNALYALSSLALGSGMLWNPFQNCGQPFFANIQAGLLYPPHWILLVLDLDIGVKLITVFDLAIGGLATFALCRQLGADWIAALCGAVTFEMGANALLLAAWSPTHIGPYVWLPAALFACERLLWRPTPGAAVLLGLVLTVQFLAGFPQTSLMTYQFVTLRVLWVLVSGRVREPVRAFAATAAGLALPPLLAAVQLLPSLEFVQESVRAGELTLEEMRGNWTISWAGFRASMAGLHSSYGGVLALVPAMLAVLAFEKKETRSTAAFFALVGGLYLVLGLDSRAFELYVRLPFGGQFRDPNRFLWLTGLSLSVLVALGSHAGGVAVRAWVGVRRLLLSAIVLGAFSVIHPPDPPRWFWILGGVGLLLQVYLMLGRRLTTVARAALALILVLNLISIGSTPFLGGLADPSLPFRHEAGFALLRERMTPQDRIYPLAREADFSLIEKSPSIFRVPSVYDYEPQTSLRFAKLFVRLVADQEMVSINQFYYPLVYTPRNRPLLNLVAARYLVVDRSGSDVSTVRAPAVEPRWERGDLMIYENTQALPRAFYVSRVEIIPDPDDLLARLASPEHDPRAVALVEAAPRDGFMGHPTATRGQTTILETHPEKLTVRVQAPAEGFLFVSDQFYPGWQATVNDQPAEILRANVAFRLVRIPSGESVVEFRYQPTCVWLGLLISASTTSALLVVLALARFRRRRSGGRPPTRPS
jgi:hypothetical protein